MISGLLSFLFFASIICFIVGLIKPSVFSRFIKKDNSRKKIAKVFGLTTAIIVILLIMSVSGSAYNALAFLSFVFFLISAFCFVAGMIKPSLFSSVLKNNTNRKRVFSIFGFGIGIAFFLFAVFVGMSTDSKTENNQNKTAQTVNQITDTVPQNNPAPAQKETPKPAKVTETLTPEQKEIKHFLQDEIGMLTVEAGKGNDNIEKAGAEWQNGAPLPYIIDAQMAFESVLKKAKTINPPAGCENIKKYFIEATQLQLNGAKTIREALETVPMDDKKAMQGLEIYNKAMLSTARTNEEINKLKDKFDLKL